ncbi:MAG: outer membrane beta-barrel protein [Acidobacteria bacterium]|nr:outer membrane beta-barrel protein [Acidobacteriota bacterium]
MSSLKFSVIPAIFLLAAAQAPAADLRFGVEVLASTPSADLRRIDSREGLGAGLTLDWPIAGPHALRTRIEYISHPKQGFAYEASHWTPNGPIVFIQTGDLSIEQFGWGLDYLYYPAGRPEGWHLDAGFQLFRYTASVKATEVFFIAGTPRSEAYSKDESRNRVGCMVGFGYDFGRSWRAGLRFTSAQVEETRLNAYTAVVGYRF